MSSNAAVGVVGFGVGNVGSVLNMFKYLDIDVSVVSSAQDALTADRLLLPGVGAFDSGVNGLAASGMDDVIRSRADAGVPILGICLGMQLLSHSSAEGTLQGLGLIDARCDRLEPAGPVTLRVPHMGWNWVEPLREHPLLASRETRRKFYFAHSFHVVCSSRADVLAEADYGGPFSAVVGNNNVVGAQFHPEKSHRFGMELLRNFAEWTP